MQRKYNLKFSKPDPRDYKFAAISAAPTKLPKSADLRVKTGDIPIYEQGSLGSCTANTYARIRAIMYALAGQPYVAFSRLFIYWYERFLEGTIQEDSGAEMRDGMKVLANYGVSTEALCPYDITKFTTQPTTLANENALTHKIASYHSLANLNEIKQCLVDGFPVALGFTVFSEFEKVTSSGKLKNPTKKSQVLGGHAVTIVGYKDSLYSRNSGYLIIANSWGSDWADHGYFYMPYSYLTNARTQCEMWTAR